MELVLIPKDVWFPLARTSAKTTIDIGGYLTKIDIEGYLTNYWHWRLSYQLLTLKVILRTIDIGGYLTKIDIEVHVTKIDIEGYLTIYWHWRLSYQLLTLKIILPTVDIEGYLTKTHETTDRISMLNFRLSNHRLMICRRNNLEEHKTENAHFVKHTLKTQSSIRENLINWPTHSSIRENLMEK